MSRQDDIDYDRQADQIRAENAVLLEEFETWLEEIGLKEKALIGFRVVQQERGEAGSPTAFFLAVLRYARIRRTQDSRATIPERGPYG